MGFRKYLEIIEFLVSVKKSVEPFYSYHSILTIWSTINIKKFTVEEVEIHLIVNPALHFDCN